jgi:hypothetical protein
MNVNEELEIYHNISRISEILATDIFDIANLGHPLRQSAFIELVICLRDLMYKCKKNNKRISFTDNITPCNIKGEETKDVTDLITHIRDAVCHINSFKQVAGFFRIMFSTNFYNDDIIFCYGKHELYLKRHILRAFKEAQESLLPLLEDSVFFRDRT